MVFFVISGILILLVAGFYGAAEAWPQFGFCLVLATILLVCGLLESQHRRFMRKLDKLEEFIHKNQQRK